MPRATRTLREFAEQEVVLTSGDYKGQRFRCSRQPFTGPLLDLIGSNRWPVTSITGPTQDGKTLLSFLLPIMYHLFEVRETVVVGAYDLAQAADKWAMDLRPIIAKSGYADLMPRSGSGSRGGRDVMAVEFLNGATLRFMTAGSHDRSVAGVTTRVVVQTEVDGYGALRESSDEADRVTQIDARTKHFQARRRHRIYHECTPSTPDGRIWQEREQGTQHLVLLPCPGCGHWWAPEREHVVGWQEARDAFEARERARLACPACGHHADEDQRRAAVRSCVVAGKGQTVDEDAEVHGELPRTDIFSFRWNVLGSLLKSLPELAAEEWAAARKPDREAAERGLLQFSYAVPVASTALSVEELDPDALARRTTAALPRRGVVPAGRVALGLGCDVGKHLLHWALVALLPEDGGHVVDYGRVETGVGDDLPEGRAIANALGALRSRAAEGWLLPDGKGGYAKVSPDWAWVDVNYRGDVVEASCAQASAATWLPARGLGWHQRKTGEQGGRYRRPAATSRTVVLIGDDWHLVRSHRSPVGFEVQTDADRLKAWVRDRYKLRPDAPGALTVYRAPNRSDHLPYYRHVASEQEQHEVVPGVGMVRRFTNPTGKSNHWLDATALAAGAARFALAWRALQAAEAAAGKAVAGEGRYARLPDGRPFLATRRGDG